MTRAATLSPVLSKEIRALLPLWAACAATLAAAFVWRGNDLHDVAVMAYVGGSFAIGAHSIGHEYSYRTLPILLTQPGDRRRAYLVKSAVLAVMLLTLAAFAWNVLGDTVWRAESRQFQLSAVTLPVLCGLFLAPLATMICRSSLAGTLLSGTVPALMWLVTVAAAWFWFGIDADAVTNSILGRWTLAMVAVFSLAGFLGWRRFVALEATDVASRALHLPRWLGTAAGARRHAPLRALAAKEVHLQQLAFGAAGLNLVAWGTLLLVRRYVPSWSAFPMEAVMLLYCITLAIVIGALASAEERQHRTLAWQMVLPAPAWQQWLVKVGVALGLALLFAVGLPLLLMQITPQEGPHAGHLTVLIVLLTAGSIYISSLSSSGIWAMAWSVPIGVGGTLFVQAVSGALEWVMPKLSGSLMAGSETAAVASSSDGSPEGMMFAMRAFALALIPLLLWLGFLNHTSSERTARRILQQVASIALVITLVAAALAFYELRR